MRSRKAGRRGGTRSVPPSGPYGAGKREGERKKGEGCWAARQAEPGREEGKGPVGSWARLKRKEGRIFQKQNRFYF